MTDTIKTAEEPVTGLDAVATLPDPDDPRNQAVLLLDKLLTAKFDDTETQVGVAIMVTVLATRRLLSKSQDRVGRGLRIATIRRVCFHIEQKLRRYV
jgi:hypothetical protein